MKNSKKKLQYAQACRHNLLEGRLLSIPEPCRHGALSYWCLVEMPATGLVEMLATKFFN
jgi:hypothetical protein